MAAIIRPFERPDAPAVAALMERHLLRRPLPGGDTAAFLTATTLDHPWADPELPSLVAADEDGRIVGFIASQPRRLRLDGQPVRGVLCSHLVVDPDSRAGAVGVLLVRQLMAGPQALTWSDTGVEVVVRLFRTVGGHADHVRACDWMLVVGARRWLGAVARGAVRDRRVGREVVPVGGFPVQAAGRRLVRRGWPAPEVEVNGEEANARSILEHVDEVTARARLRPDYDEAYLEALFELIERTDGALVRRLVRRRGRVVGWHVSLLNGRALRLLQLASTDRHVDAVLQDLLEDARRRGAAVVAGRLEPHLHDALAPRLPVLGLTRSPIIHSREPGVREALGAGSALLTRLDGEWWVL